MTVKLYRANGSNDDTPTFIDNEEAIDDIAETKDVLDTISDLIETGNFEEAVSAMSEIKVHINAVDDYIKQKAQN